MALLRLRYTSKDDSVWLSQAQMMALFGKTKQSISLHIRNIFKVSWLRKQLSRIP